MHWQLQGTKRNKPASWGCPGADQWSKEYSATNDNGWNVKKGNF